MKFISLFLLLPFLIPSVADSHKEKISEILYTSFDGGKGGGFSSLKITKAYVLFETGRRGTKSVFSEPTNPLLWKKLCKTNLREFDKIVSTERTAPSDGTDEELHITTNVKTHSFLNGQYWHSKKIKVLMEALQKEMTDVAKPANQKYPE